MLGDDKDYFYPEQDGKQGNSKKASFDFKLDADITREFKHSVPDKQNLWVQVKNKLN